MISSLVPSIQTSGLDPVFDANSLAMSQDGRRFLLITSLKYEVLTPNFLATSFCLILATVSMVHDVHIERIECQQKNSPEANFLSLFYSSQFANYYKMNNSSTYRYFITALHYFFPKKFNSQKQLAIEADVSKSMINEILKGKKFGTPDMHQKIANAFGFELFNFYDAGRQLLSEKYSSENNKNATVTEPNPKYPVKKKGRKSEENTISLSHDEIIKLFKDKSRAKAMNYMLAELEEMDPDGYEKTEMFITALYERIKKAKKKSNGNS